MIKKYDVIVVGAGAAGMMAAISAARAGAKTAILEHMEQAGKKILATGNGKCNFTNQVQGIDFYRGQDPAFVLPVFQQFGLEETLTFFKEIGIFPKEKRGGYYYPASEQATAVRQALFLELQRLGVKIYYNIGIRSIQKQKKQFIYDTKQETFISDRCIIATGSKAAKKTGSDGSGVPYIKGFGHQMIEFLPALVQLQGKQSFLKELAGIRADATVTLFTYAKNRSDNSKHMKYAGVKKSHEILSQDRGEVQLTDFGVSGIPAFQVSRYAVIALREKKDIYVTLDFAPDMKEEEIMEYFYHQKQRNPKGKISDGLIGFLNNKLIPVLLKEAKMQEELIFERCRNTDLQALIAQIKSFRIDIIGSKSFDYAQVCSGGVCTEEICAETMESKLVKGLFFAGEVVDIDGMCGGYNLQWAWSSGWVAGQNGGRL